MSQEPRNNPDRKGAGQPEESGFPNTQKKDNTSIGEGQEDQLQGGSGSSSDPQKTEMKNFGKAGTKSTGKVDSKEKDDPDPIDEFRKENERETK